MRQINLALDEDQQASPTLNRKQIQALVTAMADAILAVLEDRPGEGDDPD